MNWLINGQGKRGMDDYPSAPIKGTIDSVKISLFFHRI